jgi:uridine kinase
MNIEKVFSEHTLYFYISTTLLSESKDNEYSHLNTYDHFTEGAIVSALLVKTDKNNEYRNALNYLKKISRGISIIDDEYDLYIVLRSDCIIKNSAFLENILDDGIYFPSLGKNNFTKSVKERVNEQIIITKSISELNKLVGLYDFGINNTNYSDIILFNFLKEQRIDYKLIDIEYKLLLSDCNLIAISGDSGSGKTTLSKKILKMFNEEKVLRFETDRYHKWERGDNNYTNYTHLNPYANKLELMTDDVYNLKIGDNIYQVDYDHNTGKFTQKEKIESKDNIIICGLHTLYLEELNKIIDIKIFIDTERELIKEWKLGRDKNERKHTEEHIIKQMESRKEDYYKYISTQKENADLIVNFYKDNDEKLKCNLVINNRRIFDSLHKYIIKYNYEMKINENGSVTIYLKNDVEPIYNDENIKRYYRANVKSEKDEYNFYNDEIISFLILYIYKE